MFATEVNRIAVGVLLLVSSVAAFAGEVSQARINKWEPAIQEFERQDAEAAFAPNGIVFVGSSSVRRWDLQKWFPGLPVLNRGFGGSRISDVNHFLDRVVLKYKPKTIVLYAGDNDIAGGRSAKRVVEDFREFCVGVYKELPEAKILFVAIKPCPKRWHLADVLKEANAEIAKLCQSNDRLIYVDVWTPMLTSRGEPRPELFAKDNLHLNAAGYELWAKLLLPHVK